MKTMSVREVKAGWPLVERSVLQGEEVLVLNHGRPAAQIGPPVRKRVEVWENHLDTAIPNRGASLKDVIDADRGGRW